jgi:energy-coupling factor transporter ATP-binding protein EcfA2
MQPVVPVSLQQPQVSISQVTFSDGTTISLKPSDVVVIVGPNNGGKSATLRAIRDKVNSPPQHSPVVGSVSVMKTGTADELAAWLPKVARPRQRGNPQDPQYEAYGTQVNSTQARQIWADKTGGMQSLGRFFCHLLTADERLAVANAAQAIALTQEALRHPIHFLQHDDRLEQRLSEQFRQAFGVDLIVHRNAGNQVPLYVGQRPAPGAGEDRVSRGYLERLELLPLLHAQGDGMRSFAGVLLHTSIGHETILLIDEPEAFLHPPQARLLGQMLVRDKHSHRQVFIATHSGDVLRGMLDGNQGNVRVVRIRRDGDVNRVKELDPDQVRELWTDPLLRSSNILDGVFHERVVVTEGDGDARFFSAVADVIYEGTRRPDVMFTHTGGKDRLPLVVRSLRALDVPVVAVADFDILNNDHPLNKLVEAAGGDWAALKPRWNSVKKAVEQGQTQKSTADVKAEIEAILNGVTSVEFPRDAKRKIEEVLKQSSIWALAKRAGKSILQSGTATQEYDRLAGELRKLKLFVLEVGELERFSPALGNHGPAWVNEVLQKDLKADPALQGAREFVKGLLES